MKKTRELIYVIAAILIGMFLIGKLSIPLLKKAHRIKARKIRRTYKKLDEFEDAESKKTFRRKKSYKSYDE